MSKKVRNLRLLSQDERIDANEHQGAPALVSSSDLAVVERKLVEQIVNVAAPGSGLIAVLRCELPWDLRPVVMKAGEAQPSVIRLCGPLGSSTDSDVALRLQSSLERTKHAFSESDVFLEWGTIQGRVWFRRTLYNTTLAQVLETHSFSPQKILTFTRRLIEQTISLHAYGVVHGHISTSNITLDENERPILLDTGFAFAQLQDGIARSISFAPELQAGSANLVPSADVYGIGQVCQLLVIKAQRKVFEQDQAQELLLDALAQRLEPTLSYCESSRPALHQLLSTIRELAPEQTKVAKKSVDVQTSHSAQVQSVSVSRTQDLVEPQETVVEEVVGTTNTEVQLEASRSMWWVYLIALASLAFCLWTIYPQYFEDQEETYSTAELRAAWSSGLPSKIKPVIELAALYPGSYAEQLLVRSARRGESLPQGINANLLQIAFDDRWEMQLNEADRSAAVLLATAGFVKHSDTSALANISEIHPGVVFAITATAPDGAHKSLKRFDASRLSKLPGRIGDAFSKLVGSSANIDCSDPAVIQTAKFATFGVQRPADVFLFLQQDFSRRLAVLTALFAGNQEVSKQTMQAIFHFPNGELSHHNVQWAKKWNLELWEISEDDKLRVLAGQVPDRQIGAEYIGVLFSHPSASMRKYAVVEARDRIQFKHLASFKLLSLLAQNPKLLSAEQLFKLAKILEKPSVIELTEISAWVETKPANEILAELIVATAKNGKATKVDTFVAMQLKAQKWEMSLEEAKKLRAHPDDYTRMFTYQQLFKMSSTQSFELLQESMRDEKNPAFREQLAAMLSQMHSSLNP